MSIKILVKKLTKIKFRHLVQIFYRGLDTILFFALVPVYVLLFAAAFISRKTKKKKKTVFFAGLEHVIDKTVIRGKYFEEKGFKVIYYSFETTGKRSTLISHNMVIKANKLLTFDVLCFWLLCIKHKPVYIELYFEKLGLRQYFYSLMHIANITIISIHRGIAKDYEKNSAIRNKLRDFTYKNSDLILYRDIKMKKIFNAKTKIKYKAYYDYNRVKIYQFDQNKKKSGKNILFLNGIRDHRRIDLVIESASILKVQFPDVMFSIIGCRNADEYAYVNALVEKNNVKENVYVDYWTNTPTPYYENATIFVFPSDSVFCNFSLLESMERGIPAIVASVEDADKIIKHGVNGYLVQQTAEDLAKYIIRLITDEDLRVKMGKAARQTIIEKFNDKDRMTPIYNLLLKRYKDII